MEMHGAASTRINHLFVTGSSGIGKTTVCKKVIPLLEKIGLTCEGFFTEEVRSSFSKKRIGFDVVSVKNPENRLPLARTTDILEPGEHLAAKHRVGNYVVYVKNFEQISLPIFQTNSDVLLVDEIGKMELFSELFTNKISEFAALNGKTENKPSRCMLATIPQVFPCHLTLLKKIHSNPHCKILQLNDDNRDDLPEDIAKMILNIVHNK